MNIRAILISLVAIVATSANAANTPPLSDSWNIAPAGTASSSGELLFRVTPGDGGDATEVTVFVLSGTNDTGVASNIRRALNSQLRADRFNVEPGEGANVLDVENVRVVVQSAAPVAPPTVPERATPANPPQVAPETPPAAGDAVPPPPVTTPSPGNASQPVSPSPANSPSLPNPTPAPNETPGGAPASAPPPPG
jgi:hypothetical protein